MGRREREAVRQDLLRSSPDIVTRVVAEIRRTVPAYRALHDSQLAEVRAIARWVTSRLLAMWVDGTGVTTEDADRVRSIGRARAADGRAADAVVRAYRVGAAAANRLIAEHAGGVLSPDDVFALNRIWLTELETLTEALATGHADAARRLDADRDRARRAFLDDLLVGRQSSRAAIADRSRALDVRLPDEGVLLVAEPARRPRDASVQATTAVAALELASRLAGERPGSGGADVLCTARGGQLVLFFEAASAAPLGPLLRSLALRGCLLSGHPVDDLAGAYRLAQTALEAAPARAFDGDGLLRSAEAQVVALLSAAPGAAPATVRRQVLGRLLESDHRHLTATLDAYLRTGSATAAAEALHLHPQTLRYRMRRIRELTGRDPRDPWQRLMLDIARTVPDRPRPPGPPGRSVTP